MRRRTIGLPVLLAVLAAPPLAAEPAVADAIEEAALWLGRRVDQLREGPEDDETLRSRVIETLKELRQRLVRGGVDEGVADALAPTVPHADGEASRRAALHSLRSCRRRLEAYAAAVRRPPPAVPEGAPARLEAILDDPVFASTPDKAGFLERMMAGLNRLLYKQVSRLFDATRAYPLLVIWLIILVVVITGVLLLARLWPRRGRRPERLLAAEPGGLLGASESMTPEALLIRAEAAARAGQRIGALRVVQLAVVTALRESEQLPGFPGLTDLEGIRFLEKTEVRGRFERLARLHDRAVYGGRTPDAAVVSEALQLAALMIRTPAGGPP